MPKIFIFKDFVLLSVLKQIKYPQTQQNGLQKIFERKNNFIDF